MNNSYTFHSIFQNADDKKDTIVEIDGLGKACFINSSDVPYFLFIPNNLSNEDRLVFEANNCETNNYDKLKENAFDNILRLVSVFKSEVPVMVPIIPSYDNRPYYQQLSGDMFYEREYANYPDKINDIIGDAIQKIESITGVKLDDKIFMNGYSSSAVFAQRFALFHPERIDTLCVGGASGSIPVPTTKIEYPCGVGGLSNFDSESYKKIKFRYYVGEYETVNDAKVSYEHRHNNRVDLIDGSFKYADRPMHDMTYFPRSMDPLIGKKYRDLFGTNYFERLKNVVKLYEDIGIDMKSDIVKGRAHRRLRANGIEYLGVAEIGDKIVENTYNESKAVLKNIEEEKKL